MGGQKILENGLKNTLMICCQKYSCFCSHLRLNWRVKNKCHNEKRFQEGEHSYADLQ